MPIICWSSATQRYVIAVLSRQFLFQRTKTMDPLLGTATVEGHAPGPDLDLVPGHVHALAPPKGDQGKTFLFYLHCSNIVHALIMHALIMHSSFLLVN